jgi:antitoxin PrlF
MASKVTLNDRGVITIPAQLRQAYGLKPNDELIVEDTGTGILLRPSISVPIEIYTDDRIAEFARDEAAIGKYLPKAQSKKMRKST